MGRSDREESLKDAAMRLGDGMGWMMFVCERERDKEQLTASSRTIQLQSPATCTNPRSHSWLFSPSRPLPFFGLTLTSVCVQCMSDTHYSTQRTRTPTSQNNQCT